MKVKTYRAKSMREALTLVRRELGPDAAVLHTREVQRTRLLGLMPGVREIEVTASAVVNVPSRLPPQEPTTPLASQVASPPSQAGPELSGQMKDQLDDLQQMVQELCRRSPSEPRHELPEELFRLFTDLLDSELSEELARELVERIRLEAPDAELADPVLLKARIARMIEADVTVSGPIQVTPGQRRLVALVGPTGVGKTTTIAKLAANYRLREKRRVGLITVDTYRIAAVEQLRTYADIIDLPMQVVSTPREMREAADKMRDLDLVLMDTAGRSPKDEVKIRELKAFLAEAGTDEVHLVLSAVAGAKTLVKTAQQFAAAGTTSLILTKLDEATGLGNVLPVLRDSHLPLSYLTNGQNVPDDIEPAATDRLARWILTGAPQ